MIPILLICGPANSGKDTVAGMIAKTQATALVAQADPMKRLAASVFGFDEQQLWGPSECRNQPDGRYATLSAWEIADTNMVQHGMKWIQDVLPGLTPEEFGKAWGALATWFGNLRDAHSIGEHHDRKITKVLTPRYMLQTIGTEWGRQFSSTMWNDYAIRTARTLLGGGYTYDRKTGLAKIAEEKATPDQTLRNTVKGIELVVITDGRFINEILGVKAAGGVAIRVENPAGVGEVTGGVAGHKSEAELNAVPRSFFDYIIINDKAQGLRTLENTVVEQFGRAFFTGPTVFDGGWKSVW